MRISNTRIKTNRLAPDPHYNNVTLLLTMDGANGSTTFTDRSSQALSITANNGAVQTTANYKFGTASGTFSVGAFVNTPNSALFAFGNQPFTIECWIYRTGNSYNQAVISTRVTAIFSPFEIICDQGTVSVLISNSTITAWQSIDSFGNVSIPLNTWVHVAFVGDGTNLNLYVNGIKSTTTLAQPAWNNATSTLYFGKGGNGNFQGELDDIRVTKGVARYTSNFTPPSAFLQINPPNYKISSRQEADPFYDNVSLLLKMDGANGSTTFTDSSPTPKTVTRNGTVAISNARINPKLGVTNAYFNGPGNSLDVAASTDLALTGDFTVEWWHYLTAWPAIATYPIGWTPGQYVDITPNGRLSVISTANINTPLSTIVLNTWQHIAISRSGTTTRIFVNGIEQASGTGLGNLGSGTAPVYISASNTGASGANTYGYMDDIRITKGIARYTSNFTVPNESFPAFGVRSFRMTRAQSTTFSMSNLSGYDFNTTATIQVSSTMNELSQVDFNTIAITNVAITMTG